MTDTEFDILDELYFVSAFPELARNLDLPDKELADSLENLIDKGLVKCFYPDPETEVAFQREIFRQNFQQYYFLATKAGLLAHNSL